MSAVAKRAGVAGLIVLLCAAKPVPPHDPDGASIDRVSAALLRHQLLHSACCVPFIVDHDSEPGPDDVDLRERHDAQCVGNPDIAPRTVSVPIDRKTGRMTTDARFQDRIDGTVSPLD
ncbi:hypothetical protein NFI95_06935 [Acetobacteraceae bacterium KSS8]|uniref:Uncharacterized protein n=1 Tax=Endosaccharibacter trunci TaxID=2812733 RepID=A0ABT1W5L5_9PROT|nr:hypothetical protein [Acetobacteraceae bacterium KSS8]